MDYNTSKTVAEQFLSAYFQNVDPNALAGYYGNDSLLSFESEVYQGPQNIIEKLGSIKVQSKVNSYDAQPTVGGSILIYLCGVLLIEGESNPINFTRIFVLAPANNSFYVKNDIFKITFG